MKTNLLIFIFILFCNTSFGQDAIAVKTLLEPHPEFNQTEEEKKVIVESTELINELGKNGYLIRDSAVIAYLQEILTKIKPAELAAFPITIHILRDPEVNAVSLPDGSILVYLGLISLMENEAQMAFILSHELAHFIERHAYKMEVDKKKYKFKQLEKKSTKMTLSDLKVSQEVQADSLGLELFKKSGYDVASASRSLDLLPREDTAFHIAFLVKVLLPVSFEKGLPTHPKTDDRVAYVKQATSASTSTGFLGQEIYIAKTGHILALNIKAMKSEMELLKYVSYLKKIRDNLDVRNSNYYQWLTYEIGVGYQELYCDPLKTGIQLVNAEKERLNGKGIYVTGLGKGLKTYDDSKDFLEKESLSYFSEIENNPEFSWRINKNKGLICYQKKDYACAKKKLTAYLNSGNVLPDKRFINSIVKEIDKLNKK